LSPLLSPAGAHSKLKIRLLDRPAAARQSARRFVGPVGLTGTAETITVVLQSQLP
jgi:hypothetical protein